jgi:hypothetical protein
MKLDFTKLVPVGLDYRRELSWVRAGCALSFLYSLGFLIRLHAGYEELFTKVGMDRVLTPGAVMPDFTEILAGSLAGFGVVALCMAALAAWHYFYHYQGSKSIYLMRRLPDRWELARRCAALPVLSAAAAVLLAFLVPLAYFGVYLLVTPEGCLTPGQWQKIWSIL